MDEAALREIARAVVRDRKLPNRPPDGAWGGPGAGVACAVCDLPVRRDEMEFEIQFRRNDANPDFDRFHVHVWCFAAWEVERRAAQRGPAGR